jgi:bifunctional NMN adenylyltransferase/nudix hydrolase
MRNPFTFDERKEMIEGSIAELQERLPGRVVVRPLNDHLYNDAAWIEAVQSEVFAALLECNAGNLEREQRVGVIGHAKDHSSYYLRIFPKYESIDVPAVCAPSGKELINATILRTLLYDMLAADASWNDDLLKVQVPHAVAQHLRHIVRKGKFREVLEDVRFVRKYQADWISAPYPPTFVTVDAVVQCCGHVLMVTRKAEPGRGRLALPGGFIQQDEPLLNACLRELQEETQIKVPQRVLIGSLQNRTARPFDDPHRSSRGRTITHAFRFDLGDVALPRVKGGDDAAEALWVPIAAIKAEQCFEDHAHIIRTMLEVS